jgi:hypothetical protein
MNNHAPRTKLKIRAVVISCPPWDRIARAHQKGVGLKDPAAAARGVLVLRKWDDGVVAAPPSAPGLSSTPDYEAVFCARACVTAIATHVQRRWNGGMEKSRCEPSTSRHDDRFRCCKGPTSGGPPRFAAATSIEPIWKRAKTKEASHADHVLE